MHETEIRKNFDKLEQYISKSEISIEEFPSESLSQMDLILKDTEKRIKSYQLSTDYSNSSKIKEFQNKFQTYKNKYRSICNKSKNNIKGDYSFFNNRDDPTQGLTSKSFNKIQLATKNTIEMENMTGNILGDLNNQTEIMKGVKTKLSGMDSDLNTSNSLLGSIIGKQNDDMKTVIIVGAVLFFIIICFLLYKIVKIIV
jgi:hypothetical protein